MAIKENNQTRATQSRSGERNITLAREREGGRIVAMLRYRFPWVRHEKAYNM